MLILLNNLSMMTLILLCFSLRKIRNNDISGQLLYFKLHKSQKFLFFNKLVLRLFFTNSIFKFDLNYLSSSRGIPLKSYFTTSKSPDMSNIFKRKTKSVPSIFDFSMQLLYKKRSALGDFKNVS